MSNKFFITERGDVAYQITSVRNKLKANYRHGDALLIVTKKLVSPSLQELCLEYKHCTIVHNNVTGFGGTYLEPGVSSVEETIEAFYDLRDMGFPEKQMVLRIDPIIPTDRGIATAMNVLSLCPDFVKRVRVSFIDNYNHMSRIGLPWNSFNPPQECMDYAVDIISAFTNERKMSLDACGEPSLAINSGCISIKDYDILGLPRPDSDKRRGQRKGCMCLSTKTEILDKPLKCPNGCLYCYYRLGG